MYILFIAKDKADTKQGEKNGEEKKYRQPCVCCSCRRTVEKKFDEIKLQRGYEERVFIHNSTSQRARSANDFVI